MSVDGDGEVNVDGLWLAVDAVQVFTARACEDETVPSFVDAFVTDATAPDVHEGPAEATDYCGALIVLSPAGDPGDGPGELAEHSFLMTGRSEEGRPFLVRSKLSFDIPLFHDEGDFLFDEDQDLMDIGVDVAAWIDELDLDDGRPDGTGTIVIDESRNTELLRQLEEELLDAMELEIHDD